MISRWEELRLVAQCAAADNRRAFTRLVETNTDPLRRFLLNLTLGDAALTDDLAQETFLKAYLQIRQFRGLSRFRTWLYRIAINEYYTHCRRRSHEPAGPPPDDFPQQADPSDPHAAIDASIDVAARLKVLTEHERTAILLFYLQDKPIKEIADIMQAPEGTIKSYLSRAKAKKARIA